MRDKNFTEAKMRRRFIRRKFCVGARGLDHDLERFGVREIPHY
jgi:hypothetical protein